MAGTKAGARKAAATRKRNAAKKGKKSTAKRTKKRSSASKRMGKTVASPTFAGKKFKCAGKKVRVGKRRAKVARVFCRRAKKA